MNNPEKNAYQFVPYLIHSTQHTFISNHPQISPINKFTKLRTIHPNKSSQPQGQTNKPIHFSIHSKFQIYSDITKIRMKQQSPHLAFSTILVQKWTEKSSQRGSRIEKEATSQLQKEDSIEHSLSGLQIIGQLFQTTSFVSFHDFNSKFVFGERMSIWRKGRLKEVMVFTDQHIPNLLWVSSKTKAFLFDLCYTTLSTSDVELELSSEFEHYFFVLSYFQQKIPFVFEDLPTLKKYRIMFQSAIHQYQKKKATYPPELSKLTKHYTLAEMLESGKRASSVPEILRIADKLAGPERRPLYEDILRDLLLENPLPPRLQFHEMPLHADQVMLFFKIASCNENLKAIYENYAGVALEKKSDYTTPFMGPQQLTAFLQSEQHETRLNAARIVQEAFIGPVSFYEFCNFLSSKKYNYLALTPALDPNLPLNHYFCYSSHNTYLSGNQLTSDSKIQRYLEDLSNGLKCLEIDVHDSGEELIVTHALNGMHLNKQVSFEEVIRQIGHYCSKLTDFHPIILSIENRTSKDSYYRMASIFEKYLGPYLLTLHSNPSLDHTLQCHTLAQLKNKVIIKADVKFKELLPLSKKQIPLIPFRLSLTLLPAKTLYKDHQFNQRQMRFEQKVREFEHRKNKFESEFMVSYYQPIDQMAKVTALFRCQEGINSQHSLGYESTSITSKKLEKTDQKLAIQYSKRSFLRVYPVGTEISSSNYNPIPGLERGAQLIALNTQTKDQYAWLMMSFFSAGLSCAPEHMGFIEKPLHLRTNQPKPQTAIRISVSILSGLHNTRIRFFGSERDVIRNQQNCLSFQLTDPEVGFFMFQMDNGMRDCIPVRFIREGYRVIVGRNRSFIDCGVRVLLRVKIRRSQLPSKSRLN